MNESAAQFKSGIALSELQALYMGVNDSLEEQVSQPSCVCLRQFPTIKSIPSNKQKRILVTGGAGFVGSHLVDRLMLMGHLVIVIDNYFTGSRRNIAHWIGHPNFEFIRHDVVGC